MRINSRPLKVLWIATQLVAIVACVFIVYASVHSMFIHGNAARQGGEASVGGTIEIHGFNPHKSQYNIVIAMRVNCPYCTSSAGFYQRLISASSRKQIPVIAIFPDSVQSARGYLAKLQLPIENLYQVLPGETEVDATPTLMIVDSSGQIKQKWVGQLPTAKEDEVLSSSMFL